RLERAGSPIVLGGRALDLLVTLAERAGEVVSKRELMERVWPDLTVEEINLRVTVAGLRKALGEGDDGGQYIANVPGRGYCLGAPVEDSEGQFHSLPAGPLHALSPLPPRLARMLGRDRTVEILSALVLERRFVSIVGPGGMGKTTVAVAVAHGLAEAFQGQVAVVDLASLAGPGLGSTVVSISGGATPVG